MTTMSAAATAAERTSVGAIRSLRLAAVMVWAVAIVVPALMAAEVVLHLRTGDTDLTGWWFGDLGLAAVLLPPGVLVAAKRPDNAIGWLLCAASLTTAASGAGRQYLAYGVLDGFAPGHLRIGWFTDSLYIISMATLPLTLMLFPDGRPMSRRARPLLLAPVAFVVLMFFGQLFIHGNDVDVQGRTLTNLAGNLLPAWLPEVAMGIGSLLFFASIVIAIAALIVRYRRTVGEARQQMKWVVWAGTIAIVELASEVIPGNELSPYTGPVASSLLTASVCVAILRHRMFDIDVVINRTLVFAMLTLLVAGVYVAVVAALGAALGTPTPLGPGLAATAIIAVAFAPARARVQRRIDRLVYGERRNPYRVMTQLGERLQSEHGADELAVVVQTVAQALKLPYAGIFGSAGDALAQVGVPGVDAVDVSLSYQGSAMGHLLVRPAQPRGFDRDTRRLLTDLAGQIGAAVHAVRLSSDLQASRRRLVSAKEEERRRLRRDLHDGLGPKLAALGLKLDTAHALADTAPEASKAVLGGVKEDIRETIGDIRRLVYGLRPPALDELGLVAALRECGARFDGGADVPQIEVSGADDLLGLPAAVEVAAYWVANEAITNAVRHSGARHCDVRLWLSQGPAARMLHVGISDDGSGLPLGWRPGVGTSSMRERAVELGGTVEVLAGPGGRGTVVQALIPCEAAHE